jgi:hypothetical protein
MKIMTAKIAAALPWLFLLTGTAAYADQSPEQFYIAYRTVQTLEAGRSYIFETSNLRWRDSLQGAPAATYLLVFSQEGNNDRGTLVAHGGARDNNLGSRVQFTPTVTGTYRIVVASNNTVVDALPEVPGSILQCGNADLTVSYLSDSAEVRQRLVPGIPFCGMSHYIEYHAGECFRANASAPNVDPFIYFIPAASQQTPIATNSPIRWADNTSGTNASLCFDDEGSGWILSTAATLTGEGPGTLDLVEHTRVHTADLQNIDDYTQLPVTSLIRTVVVLEGGRDNVVETAHLGKRDTFQGTNPDTVLYLIDPQTRTVVARNDDINTNEDRSRIVFRPEQNSIYEVIVRARTRTTPGRADLYVNGFRLLPGQHFAGEMLRPLLKDGLINGSQDCVATTRTSGDPFFVWLLSSSSNGDPGVGARVVEDNDDGAGVNAKVCFSDFRALIPSGDTARGMLILGSASTATEGVTKFDIDGSNHY